MVETKHVRAEHDPEARVWWAMSDDIPGLVTEGATLEALMDRVLAVAAELLEANGLTARDISIEFTTVRPLQVA